MAGRERDGTVWRTMEWRGSYFDGRTARRHDVVVSGIPGGLRIIGEGVGPLAWQFTELRQGDTGTAGEPLRLERGADVPEMLVVEDPRFLHALRLAAPEVLGVTADPVRRRRLWRVLVPSVVAALGALASLYVWGLPFLARHVASRLPVAFEDKLGRSVVEGVTTTAETCSEPDRVAAMSSIVSRLTAEGRGGPYQYRVTIIRDSLVNAMAAPGGHLIVFTGLIEKAGSPEELAGVLAHEIQHVTRQHGTRGVLREIPMRLLAAAITGSGAMGDGVATAAVALGGLRYARADETEADVEGMRMLRAAAVDPAGMVRFFVRLEEEGEDAPRLLSYLSSHPRNAERLASLQAMAREEGASRPLLDAVEWEALRASCAP